MTGNIRSGRITGLPYVVCAAFLAALFLFYFCYRHDNKYMYPRPPASMGVVRLEPDWYKEHPMFYLADGWSFYQGKMLSPQELPGHTPDAYLYLGRYGGFDLGDPDAPPHGKGTYRTVILTGDRERRYALELTPIYSRWRLWINGELVQNVGLEGEAPRPPLDAVTFTASGQIEIVAEVEDDAHFYSGMVYPPAFGVPELVSRTVSLRLLIHGGVCIAALFIGILCALMGAGCRFRKPYGALSVLCLSFFCAAAWPVLRLSGAQNEWLLSAPRAGYYGIFLSLIWIQGRLCSQRRRVWYPALAAGLFVCLTMLIEPAVQVATARPLYLYAQFLAAWKWTAGLWLLFTSIQAIRLKRPYSGAMLAGNCVFAAALIMDRLLPLYEPVLTGWFAELAGGILILLVTGIVIHDVFMTVQEGARLRMEQALTQVQLDARSRYASLQQKYIEETRRKLHESRNCLTLIKHYVNTGETDKLCRYLSELAEHPPGRGLPDYTGHNLTDAILDLQDALASRDGIYMEIKADPLPAELAVSDQDLTSLLMNLFNNATEACRDLPADGERWIDVEIKQAEDSLLLICSNSALDRPRVGRTSKEDKWAHGYGMEIMGEIAGRYEGELKKEQGDGCFTAQVTLRHVI